MKIKNKEKGFTLIELLIVIAIIGILAATVLASLNTARRKAFDAKVKSQLGSLRSAAQMYYDEHGDFGTVVTDCSGPFFTDGPSNMSQLSNLSPYPAGVTIECNSSGTDYAVAVSLFDPSTYFCVDNLGSGKVLTAPLGAAVNCP